MGDFDLLDEFGNVLVDESGDHLVTELTPSTEDLIYYEIILVG